MISRPRQHKGKSVARLYFNTVDADTHWKLHQAAGYSGDILQDFVVRAVKFYIAHSNIPEQALQHDKFGPLTVQTWLGVHPSVKIPAFVDTNGRNYTAQELIAIGKAALLSHEEMQA